MDACSAHNSVRRIWPVAVAISLLLTSCNAINAGEYAGTDMNALRDAMDRFFEQRAQEYTFRTENSSDPNHGIYRVSVRAGYIHEAIVSEAGGFDASESLAQSSWIDNWGYDDSYGTSSSNGEYQGEFGSNYYDDNTWADYGSNGGGSETGGASEWGYGDDPFKRRAKATPMRGMRKADASNEASESGSADSIGDSGDDDDFDWDFGGSFGDSDDYDWSDSAVGSSGSSDSTATDDDAYGRRKQSASRRVMKKASVPEDVLRRDMKRMIHRRATVSKRHTLRALDGDVADGSPVAHSNFRSVEEMFLDILHGKVESVSYAMEGFPALMQYLNNGPVITNAYFEIVMSDDERREKAELLAEARSTFLQKSDETYHYEYKEDCSGCDSSIKIVTVNADHVLSVFRDDDGSEVKPITAFRTMNQWFDFAKRGINEGNMSTLHILYDETMAYPREIYYQSVYESKASKHAIGKYRSGAFLPSKGGVAGVSRGTTVMIILFVVIGIVAAYFLLTR